MNIRPVPEWSGSIFWEVAVMEWLQVLAEIAKIVGNCTGIIAFLAILVKPVREWLFGMKDIREAQKCQLRSDMLHTYYKHREEDTIRQYEKENFLMEYKAYKRLKGNSFIDDIEKEIRTWDVIT